MDPNKKQYTFRPNTILKPSYQPQPMGQFNPITSFVRRDYIIDAIRNDSINIIEVDDENNAIWAGTNKGNLIGYSIDSNGSLYSKVNVNDSPINDLAIFSKLNVACVRNQIKGYSKGGILKFCYNAKNFQKITKIRQAQDKLIYASNDGIIEYFDLQRNHVIKSLQVYPKQMFQNPFISIGALDENTVFFSINSLVHAIDRRMPNPIMTSFNLPKSCFVKNMEINHPIIGLNTIDESGNTLYLYDIRNYNFDSLSKFEIPGDRWCFLDKSSQNPYLGYVVNINGQFYKKNLKTGQVYRQIVDEPNLTVKLANVGKKSNNLVLLDISNKIHIYKNVNESSQSRLPKPLTSIDDTYTGDEHSLSKTILNEPKSNPLSKWPRVSNVGYNFPKEIYPELYEKQFSSNNTQFDKLKSISIVKDPGVSHRMQMYLVRKPIKNARQSYAMVAYKTKLVGKKIAFIDPLFNIKQKENQNKFYLSCNYAKHNNTQFVGLDNHIENSKINSILQLLYRTSNIRNVVLKHHCRKLSCLGCQLKFLFMMMVKSNNDNTVSAINFCRVLNQILLKKESQNLSKKKKGLSIHEYDPIKLLKLILMRIEKDFKNDKIHVSAGFPDKITIENAKEYNQMLNYVNNFPSLSLDQMKMNMRENQRNSASNTDVWPYLLKSDVDMVQNCKICNSIQCQKSIPTYILELSFRSSMEISFEQLLQENLTKISSVTEVSCKRHQKVPVNENTTFKSLPNIFNIKFANEEQGNEWAKSSYKYYTQHQSFNMHWSSRSKVKPQFIQSFPTQFVVQYTNNWEVLPPDTGVNFAHIEQSENKVVYVLRSIWCKVKEVYSDQSHFELIHCNDIFKNSWYLFNDFSIKPISVGSALNFRAPWKIPLMLSYERFNFSPNIPKILNINSLVLDQCKYITFSNDKPVPKKGDIVAIDAEFVKVKDLAVQVVGRISVVDCNGDILMDDFVELSDKEVVEDYLTKYSGLHEGDLDRSSSKHHIISLKEAYLKILFLIEIGVKFVGHGLVNDFKVINVNVPSSQILDTVEFYHSLHYRKISLKFLTRLMLRDNIQVDEHCSVEDSRAALKIYQKYVVLNEHRVFNSVLSNIYSIGREVGWDVNLLREDRPSVKKFRKYIDSYE
mmetsp:Transcript_4082/g.6041  ORF Transcript_4082/g.6041 Transcript_4082/m.6041 type:complete len:1129 (-) Transcript_4082:1206-4592(-)